MDSKKFNRIDARMRAIMERAVKAGNGNVDASKAGVVVTRVSSKIKRRRPVC